MVFFFVCLFVHCVWAMSNEHCWMCRWFSIFYISKNQRTQLQAMFLTSFAIHHRKMVERKLLPFFNWSQYWNFHILLQNIKQFEHSTVKLSPYALNGHLALHNMMKVIFFHYFRTLYAWLHNLWFSFSLLLPFIWVKWDVRCG